MSKEAMLSPVVRTLYETIRRLGGELRKYHWQKYKRADPFLEMVFGREEKAGFLGVKNVTLHDSVILNGDVSIGEGTFVGQYCTLNGGGGLKIGKNCSISVGVRIFTHDTAKWAVSGGKADYEYAPVDIGDCCFLGANAVITKGVSIGGHSVVAAGAVVTTSFPECSIIAGVPAKAIGRVDLLEDAEPVLRYFKDLDPQENK